MKIAIVGNIASIGHLISRELQKRGYEVDFYTSQSVYTTGETNVSTNVNTIEIKKTIGLPFERTAKKLLRRLKDRYDLEIRLSSPKYVKAKHSIIMYNGWEIREGRMPLEEKCFISSIDLLEFTKDSDAIFIPRCVDMEKFKPQTKKPDNFRVGHFPSDPERKGTHLFKEAIQILKDMNIDLQWVYSNDTKHDLMPKVLSGLSVLCDQAIKSEEFGVDGMYGVSAIEAMVMGIPVVCYVRDDHFEFPEVRECISNCKIESISIATAIIKAIDMETNYKPLRQYYSPENSVNIMLENLKRWNYI